MRESRTYGSVRGACDETHVPTATGKAPGAAIVRGMSMADTLRSILTRLVAYLAVVIAVGFCFWLGQRSMS